MNNELVSLFNPRQHRWQEHLTWQQDGLYMMGLTPIGRATVAALQMNNTLWRAQDEFGFRQGGIHHQIELKLSK